MGIFYHLEYSNYWLHLHCYTHNVLADIFFFRCFLSASRVYKEPLTEPFIQSTEVDCTYSVNHDWIQVLSYCKYSLSFLPVVGIEPANSSWYQPKAFFNSTSYPLRHVSLGSLFIYLFIYFILNISLMTNTFNNLIKILYIYLYRSSLVLLSHSYTQTYIYIYIYIYLWIQLEDGPCPDAQFWYPNPNWFVSVRRKKQWIERDTEKRRRDFPTPYFGRGCEWLSYELFL